MTVAWTTSVSAGLPVRGSIRWWRTWPPACQRWIETPDVATPQRVGDAAGGRRRAAGRPGARRASRVVDAPPPSTRPGAQRMARSPSASITALGQRISSSQGPVGDPALADAAQVEVEAGGPAEDGRTATPVARAATPRRARPCPTAVPSFGGETGVEQRDVRQPLADLVRESARPQGGGEGGPDGDGGPRVRVEDGQVGFGRVWRVRRAAQRSMRATTRRLDRAASDARPSASRWTASRPPIDFATRLTGTIGSDSLDLVAPSGTSSRAARRSRHDLAGLGRLDDDRRRRRGRF